MHSAGGYECVELQVYVDSFAWMAFYSFDFRAFRLNLKIILVVEFSKRISLKRTLLMWTHLFPTEWTF